jgi:hypothetical protein
MGSLYSCGNSFLFQTQSWTCECNIRSRASMSSMSIEIWSDSDHVYFPKFYVAATSKEVGWDNMVQLHVRVCSLINIDKPRTSVQRQRSTRVFWTCPVRLSAGLPPAILTEISVVSAVPATRCRDSTSFTPPSLPSKSFPIHNSLVILPCDAVYLRYCKRR